ncbi:MAG: FeoB-associated Cys-rich membrane protein [Clostridia bacterium]|nr:FeoB-associated Cys-rich membrane protein [Clostridia bacterium]
MNLATLILLLIIAMLALLAVRRIRRKKLLFSCGGDCTRCQANCKDRKPT